VRPIRLTRATVAVLEALTDDPSAWRYGYDLLGASGLESGTLYPILARLAERGFLDAAWESDPPPGRPARHLYRLTTAGRELAATAKHRRPAPPRLHLGEAT